MAARWASSSLAAIAVLLCCFAAGALAHNPGTQFPLLPGCGYRNGACLLPQDGSSFLAGQLFDAEIEVFADSPPDVRVTLTPPNSNTARDAASVLGVPLTSPGVPHSYLYFTDVKSALAGQYKNQTVYQYFYRNVTLTTPGTYSVGVSVNGKFIYLRWLVRPAASQSAKNVILFIGDGMNHGIVTATRLVSRGQYFGKWRGLLNMDRLGTIGLVSTAGVDSIITDSANSASAYNSGFKTSVNCLNVQADTSPSTFDDPKAETLPELLRRLRPKAAVGVVTTAEIQDATPAALYGHTRRRDDKAQLTDQMLYGTKNFSADPWSVVSNGKGVQPEVILGGGGRYFNPSSSIDNSDYYARYAKEGYNVVYDRAGMVANEKVKKLLGIFHWGNMDVWLDRHIYTQNLIGANYPTDAGRAANTAPTDQPDLVEMTKAALSVLEQYDEGFYLMVEGASIDKQAHRNDWERMFGEAIDFDNAIGYAKDWARGRSDTLIVVTADHAHGFDVHGSVDTDFLNEVSQAFPTAPRTTAGIPDVGDLTKRQAIGEYQQAGRVGYWDDNGDNFPDDWSPRYTLAASSTNHPDLYQNFSIHNTQRNPAIGGAAGVASWNQANPSEDPNGIYRSGNLSPVQAQSVHTMSDVPLFAWGPNANAFGRVQNNINVFFGMADALGLGTGKEPKRRRRPLLG